MGNVLVCKNRLRQRANSPPIADNLPLVVGVTIGISYQFDSKLQNNLTQSDNQTLKLQGFSPKRTDRKSVDSLLKADPNLTVEKVISRGV